MSYYNGQRAAQHPKIMKKGDRRAVSTYQDWGDKGDGEEFAGWVVKSNRIRVL